MHDLVITLRPKSHATMAAKHVNEAILHFLHITYYISILHFLHIGVSLAKLPMPPPTHLLCFPLGGLRLLGDLLQLLLFFHQGCLLQGLLLEPVDLRCTVPLLHLLDLLSAGWGVMKRTIRTTVGLLIVPIVRATFSRSVMVHPP